MTTLAESVPFRVLIAEDQAEHRELLFEALRDPRYRFVLVHDGREMLDVLTGTPPGYFAAVVADVYMPGMRGTEVLARVSSRSRFILVTASRDESIDHSGAHFGAAAILRKPFDPDELRSLVARIVEAGPPTGPRSGSTA
jgi:CheY-like chemotaxis protein